MKYTHLRSTLILIFLSATIGWSQHHGIEIQGGRESSDCARFSKAFFNRPKESRFSIKREGQILYFETNDKSWFEQLFAEEQDGLAIDIVSKNRYDCSLETIEASQIRGVVIKPIYKKDLKKGLTKGSGNSYRVLVGRVPPNIASQELEFNILFLGNNKLCQYFTIYDLESYPWDLLDMGMYLDSLTYSQKTIKPDAKDSFILRSKDMSFTIPFEKNKSDYSQEDIKPLYDSLRLTDYNIKTITIKAYASVEGSLERNLELQNERAESIARALQTFQKPTIETNISSSENWVDFFNDIESTNHADLKRLSKTDIKEKLVGSLSTELEPILSKHRKAFIELELEKIDKYQSLSADQLLGQFNEAVNNEKVDEALEIQNSLFQKLNEKVISPDFLRKMEVPEQVKFVKIFNKNSAIRFMDDVRQSRIVYDELLKLEKLAPKNKEVKYNITAVMFKLWRYKALDLDENKFKSQIAALKNYGIDNALIQRMMINYHIIKAENYMRSNKYDLKDKSVAYIHSNYKKINLSDFDYLSLAQFFSFYANTEYAIELLEAKARTIDINEDLLFYYLNLTIVNPELVKTENYRTVMLNAYNLNPTRYCGLFDTYGKGGVTFQLLDNPYLRSTYCENCQN